MHRTVKSAMYECSLMNETIMTAKAFKAFPLCHILPDAYPPTSALKTLSDKGCHIHLKNEGKESMRRFKNLSLFKNYRNLTE